MKVSEPAAPPVRSNHRVEPAKAFSAGLRAEFEANGRDQTNLPPPDQTVIDLVERLKEKVIDLSGLHDPDNVEPLGLLFISLRLGKKIVERSREVVAHLRANPHLDRDYLLRIAKNPEGQKWILCVQPRSRTTAEGIEYWVRPDSFAQDRVALQGICLDLHDTPHHLRVWASTEPMTPEQQEQLRQIFLELQREIPDYGPGRNRLDLRMPLEAQNHMPSLVRLKEDYVILGPITDPVPSQQENRELQDIESKLVKLRNSPGDRRVTVMIYRHALTTRVIHALNRLRGDADNQNLLLILARPEIRSQYPELFARIDLRRKIEPVSYDEVAKLLPKTEVHADEAAKPKLVAPAIDDAAHAAAEAIDIDTSHRRVDPDFVKTVQEVRRAEREERDRRSWGRWIRRLVPGGRGKR